MRKHMETSRQIRVVTTFVCRGQSICIESLLGGGVELCDALRSLVYALFTSGKVRVTAHSREQVTASGVLVALKMGAGVALWSVAISKTMAVVGFAGMNQRG